MAFDQANKRNYLNFDPVLRGVGTGVLDIATVLDLRYSGQNDFTDSDTSGSDTYRIGALLDEDPPDEDQATGRGTGSLTTSRDSQAQGGADHSWVSTGEGLGETSSLLSVPSATSAAALAADTVSAGRASLADAIEQVVQAALEPVVMVSADVADTVESAGAAQASQVRGGMGRLDAPGRGERAGRATLTVADAPDDDDAAPDSAEVTLAAMALEAEAEDDPVPTEDAPETVGMTFQSQKHVFSMNDIIGGYNGLTYADDGTIIDTSDTANTYLDKDGTTLFPIDSEFGYIVQDFIGAIDKERDGVYTEGWAGDIVDDSGETVGLALHNAATDTFKSGQPLGTWAAGLGGNSVKASTEHYDVMASLLSDQAYAEDPNALYTLDNDLRIIDLAPGTFEPEALHGLWVNELTQSLETSFAALAAGLGEVTYADIDFNRDGVLDTYKVGAETRMVDGEMQDVALVDINNDGIWDIDDSALNGLGVADVTDLLDPNESTTTYDIAVGDDYSVTLKDDGKLLYRWGTIIKRPNDIRMDVKLDLPDEWKGDISAINGGLGFKVTRAELVITHDITNNPNDQVRPEDYENESATGRKPAYYIVLDPDDPDGTNILWVSPRDAFGGDGGALPSYFKLDANGNVDLTAGGIAVYFPDGELAGFRNVDAGGNVIGTVLRDMSLVDLNAEAGLDFQSEDVTDGYTNAWYITMDRDPFEWSYDANDSEFIQDVVGFASREDAEAAGFTDDQLVSGPRWRLTSNKFGQDIPGVEIPLEDNSQPPFQHDNIGYPVGDTVVTTLNLLDWGGDSPLAFSGGWTTVNKAEVDSDGDGYIDAGWTSVQAMAADGTIYAVADLGELPDDPIVSAVTPNGQTLTANFFDVSFYLKGDRQDSAKLYDVQLVLEYETDPTLTDVYDYGDAPDDGQTMFYQFGLDGDLEAQRAQILAGFFLGAPVDGETVLRPDIDAEFAPLTDLYALGDDTSNDDDEGNAVAFLTPLASGELAYADVTASVSAGGLDAGYLFAWFDLDGSGTFDADEVVLDGVALTDGQNVVSFTMPEYNIGDLDGGNVYARFILASTDEGVTAYREADAASFYGEVEDYFVQLTTTYDDVIGRDADTWWAGLSDGSAFKTDNYGPSPSEDWDTAIVADLNGDGVDDIAGFADGSWIYGVTTFDFDEAEYLAGEDGYLGWRFDYGTFGGRLSDPVGETWSLDMNGDGKDEVLYRDSTSRLNALSFDGAFAPSGRLPKLALNEYQDVLVGDFTGDGTEELIGLRVDGGPTDNWRLVDYTGKVGVKNWQGSWKPDTYSFVVGDYNGDGMDDIAGRDSDGQWIVSLSEGDSLSTSKNWITYDKGEVLGGGDVDGDGLTDLILYDADHGQFMVGLATPDEETFTFSQFGGIPFTTDWVDFRLGDFDGDGLTDVAARDADTGRWMVAESNGDAFLEDQYGTWEDDVDWRNVMVGNFDATPTILSEAPVVYSPDVDDGNGDGNGAGDGTGDGSDHSGKTGLAPTPADVLLQTAPDYRVSHVFSTADIAGGYDGATQATDPSIIDFGATPLVTKDGVELHPIDSEFGFTVTDFVGAEDKVRDGVYTEGWAGDLVGEGGEQLGLLVGDARTDTLQTPNLLGTWLVGMGGSAVKASTEHYSVMQQILSDQAFPEDETALLPLDDDLRIIDYQVDADGMPVLDEFGNMVGDAMHGYYAEQLVQALEQAGEAAPVAIDFDRDGVADDYRAFFTDVDFDGFSRNVAAVDLGNDGTVDYYDTGLNGFGTFGLADILKPNESTVLEDIAVGDDYSVTLKDDGKLLYRWGNLVKRPNDVRINVTMPLPDEWKEDDDDSGLQSVFKVTAAELVVNHTVTNNPNDQVRPEDFENEAAIGTLPGYEVVTGDDGYIKWVSTADYYAGDGTLYEAGTVLRDMALVEQLNNSLLQYIGATSADLDEGFTNEWYTTMDREPFVAVYDDSGDYVVGPRWRLQADKYGQDLPSVVIPQDPSDELPVMSGEEKYEVGADTTTVLNLLDWNGTSPLALSAGWMIGSGETSVNGLNMTDDFDVSLYIKGDINPVTLYDAELVLTYEEVEIHDADVAIVGGAGDDVLVGQGGNTFTGDQGEDIFVLGYGTSSAAAMGDNTIVDFTLGEDAVGFIGYGLDKDNYNVRVDQQVSGSNLVLSLDGDEVVTLLNLDTLLEADSFYFA